ncbi:hypothetical protein Scep_009673 [Stephania cephalantha]|uniref:Uncharacterized protein n=1 Tax=Stephania cephalantha TaxID=152367 RepID=A0AAP0JTP4_9MAGN
MKEKGKIMKELIKWKKYTKNYDQRSKEELDFSDSQQFLDALSRWPIRWTQERTCELRNLDFSTDSYHN